MLRIAIPALSSGLDFPFGSRIIDLPATFIMSSRVFIFRGGVSQHVRL